MTCPCKICNKLAHSFQDEQLGNTFYHCVQCDLIFLDEEYLLSPEEEYQQYKRHKNTPDQKGYVKMFRKFIDSAVLPFSEKNGTGLDYGCGPGPVLSMLLKKKGYLMDIYDPFFAPVKVFREKTYDLITITEVAEHLNDPLSLFSSLKNHLLPGGVIAGMTLFHPETIDQFKEWWYRRDPTHCCFYTPKTFSVIARLTGLQLIHTGSANTFVLQK